MGLTGVLAALGRNQAKEMARLEKGSILVHSEKDPQTKDNVAVGQVIFSAPLETAWQVITDYESYPKFLFDIHELKVEKREGNRVWVRLKLRNIWPLPDYDLELAMEESKEGRTIRFTETEGDFTSYYGSWKLTSLGPGKTLAEYRLFSYVGWWWFPFVSSTLGNNSIVSGRLDDFRKQIRDLQIEKSLEPGKVIKPLWRKSIFKGKDKSPEPAPKAGAEDQKK